MQVSQNMLQRFAIRVSDWAEKWFPDSYVFAALGVIIVAIAAMSIGAPAQEVALAFGDGFWSLIPFTLQMSMLVVVGYVVSVSKPMQKLIDWFDKPILYATNVRHFKTQTQRCDGLYRNSIGVPYSGCITHVMVTGYDIDISAACSIIK